MTSHEALLALNMLPRVGPIRIRRLLTHFGHAESILGASPHKLQQVNGVGPELADILHRWEDHADLSKELHDITERGITILTDQSPAWPLSLRRLPDAPIALYVWGEVLERDLHSIAVVGSRRTSHYGREVTKRLSYQVAHAGFTIISGLARGIDTTAHQAALAAKGRTIAVLGSGLAQVYPPENLTLAETIAEGNGAVVSEFSLHTPPDKQTFPQRNRIVAGWCKGILVTECPARSGALITANLAGEYGRELFAVPGPIDKPTSAGCHDLIRNGATLVTDGGDILDALSFLPLQNSSPEASPPPPELTPEEGVVLDELDSQERHIDEISTATGLSASITSTTLLRLEMKKLAKQLPGAYFVRTS
jgi:DNA processing protein